MWRDIRDLAIFLCNLTLFMFVVLTLISLWVLP